MTMNKYNKNTPYLHTLLDFLRWGISQLNANDIHFGHGTDNSEDEAMLILAEALHLPYPIKAEYLHGHLTEDEKTHLMEFFEKRIQKNIPAPYLIHKAWFAGLEFYVDERVIIPRSPIAELIVQEFSPWIDATHVNNILDLCTGSGCIAIACAYAFPDAQVDAVELSPDAFAVAEKNIQQHHCEDCVTLYLSDLFQALPKEKRYDLIISNPPYVSAQEFSKLPKEYHHEPSMALLSQEGSHDGLEIVDRILADAQQHLTPEGILIIEVGNSEEALIKKYPHLPFLWLDFAEGGNGVFLLTYEQLSTIVTQK